MAGKLVKHKWENCMKIDENSWGYVRNSNISDYATIQDLLYQLASTVRQGDEIRQKAIITLAISH